MESYLREGAPTISVTHDPSWLEALSLDAMLQDQLQGDQCRLIFINGRMSFFEAHALGTNYSLHFPIAIAELPRIHKEARPSSGHSIVQSSPNSVSILQRPSTVDG